MERREAKKKYKPKPVEYLPRVDRRPLPGRPTSPYEFRESAAKKIAQTLSVLAHNADKSKGGATRFFELLPYSIEVVDNYINDYGLKIPLSKKVKATKPSKT